jgi:hypothetical protein
MAFGMGYGLGSSLSSVGVRGLGARAPLVMSEGTDPCKGKEAKMQLMCEAECKRDNLCVGECFGVSKNGQCAVYTTCKKCDKGKPNSFEAL